MPYSLLEAKEISELCTVVDCEHKTAPYVGSSNYLVVRTSNVRNGQLLMEDMKFTTSEGYEEWTQRAVPEYGDVLFTREAPAGESCLVPYNTKVCMGQRMVMLRPMKEKTDPVFLSLILNTERTKADISRLSIGSTVSRINIADIKKLKVSSPPLPEQQKIAEVLSTWDNAISATEKLIANSKQQKKALMQQLLTGKKRLMNPETGKEFDGEWEEVTLRQIGKCITGLTYSPDDVVEKGTLVLRSSNIQDGKLSFIDNVYVSSRIKEEAVSRVGDILICVRNGSRNLIGKSAYITEKAAGQTHGAFMTSFRGKNPEFVFQLFQTSMFYRQVNMNLGATINSINTSDLYKFKFTIPKNAGEVSKIASTLAAADKEIELLEAKLAHLKQEKKSLMQQLLTGKRRVKVAA